MNIIIATYGHLIKFNINTQEYQYISEEGLYYGTVLNKDNLMTIYRPDKDKRSKGNNFLKTIDIINYDKNNNFQISEPLELSELKLELDSIHTHEMIKYDNKLYINSTADGKVYIMDINNFKTLEILKLATPKNHINTLAIKNNYLYCMYHNKGLSDVYVFDINKRSKNIKGKVNEFIKKYESMGIKCHNITFWKDGFLYLESEDGKLTYFNELTKKKEVIFKRDGKFLKGLLVINNLAFVGINIWGNRDKRYNHNSKILCFDLLNLKELWCKKINTDGIINSITILSGNNYQVNREILNYNLMKKYNYTINRLGYTKTIDELSKIITPDLWDNNKYPIKNHFQKKFRNDKGIILLFCNKKCTKFIKSQYWLKYQEYIVPLINHIFGENKIKHIARLQFALLRKGEEVKMHTDQNIWAKKYHRIHICLQTNDKVDFIFKLNNKIVKEKINYSEVIEFNNKIPHSVINNGDSDRIHIILDYSDIEIKEEIKYIENNIDWHDF